jgi:hypothetical protein
MRWVSDAACVEQMKTAKRIISGNYKEKRSLG